MDGTLSRHDGRAFDEMRRITVEYDAIEWAAGSALISFGKTKVLCAVNLQNGLPPFLRGTGQGWLTAEYAMLPAATAVRTTREATMVRRNGRSVEVGRLIGRSFRAVSELNVLGDRTVIVDCDVLQADGGTRTASIIATSLALRQAQGRWLAQGVIEKPFVREDLCAVSVGLCGSQPLLDPDYQEDRELTADFNFIMTSAGNVVEVQGGGEKGAISWDQFDEARQYAVNGLQNVARLFQQWQSREIPTSNRPTGKSSEYR